MVKGIEIINRFIEGQRRFQEYRRRIQEQHRLAQERRCLETRREQDEACENPGPLMPQMNGQCLDIGVLWCTRFDWRFPWISNLYDAYRPPSLFLSKMRAAGHRLEFEYCDEYIEPQLVPAPGAVPLHDTVHLLYVMTHGNFSAQGYEALLKASDWKVYNAALGNAKLVVAVFDTCELINGPNWLPRWQQANLGPHIRLLLGCDGNLDINQGAAIRGKAFAENLVDDKKTFADAWLQAVDQNVFSQGKKAIAIGIGDSDADADNVLNTASLALLPPPRSGPQAFFKMRSLP
jgi:hypothetical protein